MDQERFDNELKRTAVQKKAVTRLPPEAVLELATVFFREHGYKAALTGRPNQMFVMGGREGELPRVTGEVAARRDVGKKGTTLVTLDAAGERLGPTMQAFLEHLRAENRKLREQESR
ncbi:hypothetical protein BH23CHL5_BH23CHL5_10090 [soil metagenome]